MPKFNEPHDIALPTVSGEKVKLRCPICASEEFLDSGPPEEEVRKLGFQHVIVGLLAKKRIVTNPVRFKHCANCGYVLQFVIGSFPEENAT